MEPRYLTKIAVLKLELLPLILIIFTTEALFSITYFNYHSILAEP